MFSDQIGTISSVLRKLHFISTAEQQSILNAFVQQYVFAAQEEGQLRAIEFNQLME